MSPRVDGHLQCTDNARNVGTRHAVSDKATTAHPYDFRGHGMPCPYEWMVICKHAVSEYIHVLLHQRIHEGIELGGLAKDGLEDMAFGVEDNLRRITLDGIHG